MATTNRRRLSAIFFSDMKGFSRAMDEDEDATLDLLREHNRIMDQQVAAHNGRVVKTVGDAYMVEFESSVDAVACALDCQRAIERHNDGNDQLIGVRIGVHSGDVVVEGDDVFGEAVNIAARLEPQAPVGGVCISEVVYTQVRKRVHATGVDMGKVALKNISAPMQLYAIMPGSEHLQISGTPQTRVVTTGGSTTRSRWVPLAVLAGLTCAAVAVWQLGTVDDGSVSPQGEVTAEPPVADVPAKVVARGPQRGGVLRLAGLYPFAGDWDLYPQQYLPHHNLVDAVAENLVFWGVAGALHPGPLESWEVSPDGLAVTMTLREGAHFHDHPCFVGGRGRPATSKDLAWSLLASKKAGYTSFLLDGEASDGGLDSRDPRALRITLERAWPFMERELAETRLLPGDLEGCQSPSSMKHLVGTGPFYLDRVTPTGGIILKRHTQYWARDTQGRALPYLDGVEWAPITNVSGLIHELHGGRLDLSLAPRDALEMHWDEPFSLRPRLKEGYADLKIQVGYSPKLEHENDVITLEPILRDGGPLRSRELRVALAQAIRRSELPLGDLDCTPRTALLDKYTLGSDSQYEGLKEDPKAATANLKRLLPTFHGEVPEIVMGAPDALRAVAEAVATQAGVIGLPVRVVPWDGWSGAKGEELKGSIDVVLRHRWFSRHGAELFGIALGVIDERAEHGWPAGGALETSATQLLSSGKREERGRLFTRLERTLVDEGYFIPLAGPAPKDVDYRLLYTGRLQGAFDEVTHMLIRYPSPLFDRWWVREPGEELPVQGHE
ncbi:MAG: ABC transporter substrate-binding protein [Myxococcota bacterium]